MGVRVGIGFPLNEVARVPYTSENHTCKRVHNLAEVLLRIHQSRKRFRQTQGEIPKTMKTQSQTGTTLL